ncbi:MAG: hypothetical protein L0Y72_07885 [Gemmataceae bacterium]|nr:hypothetical protein [Gemmataceae bacterium]MCI0738949.1 hypothetical protein [Gemmataceae bacterium]
MHVPCPVPLLKPWSPVGYQVVEQADEKATPSQIPKPHSPTGASADVAPSSLLGYRVVLVAEERVPVRRRPSYPKPSRRSRPAPERARPFPVRIAVALSILLPLALIALAVVARSNASSRHQGGVVLRQQIPVVPAAQVENRVVLEEKDLAPDGLCCGFTLPGKQENFGTAIEFVRNAEEAARLAREQGKLTLFIHVSGDFDDPAFT